jgi:hypothetical protein
MKEMTDIQQAARLSILAYSTAETIVESGFTDVVEISDEETSTQAFIAEDANTVFLVFRGTEDARDVKTDLRFLKTETFSDFTLHRGFWEAWRSIADVVAREILQIKMEMTADHRPQKNIVYCGHSLGGALASIASAAHKPDKCITFGAPPAGGRAFKAHTDALPTEFIRYVHDADPVPRLLKWNPFYRQTGQLRFIDDEMLTHIEPSWFFMMTKRFPFIYQPSDHEMINYTTALYLNGE